LPWYVRICFGVVADDMFLSFTQAVSGIAADARQLVKRAAEECSGYKQNFSEAIPPKALAERLAGYLHAYTCYWYLRPFGASILVAGYNVETNQHELWMAEPSGDVAQYRGAAAGKGTRSAKTEIEKGRFMDKTCREALPEIARVLHTVHDTSRDKPFALEMYWLCKESSWLAAAVPGELLSEAEEAGGAAAASKPAGAASAVEQDEDGDIAI